MIAEISISKLNHFLSTGKQDNGYYKGIISMGRLFGIRKDGSEILISRIISPLYPGSCFFTVDMRFDLSQENPLIITPRIKLDWNKIK